MTIYKIKLDETALLHYLAAIEFRIDYYTKRIDAIHTIKEKIQDNYTQVLKDAQQSLDYHKELKADLLKQKAKSEKTIDKEFDAAIGQSGDFREAV